MADNHTGKTLAIFGGTGKTGQHLVSAALAAGYSVNVLARTPSKLTLQHPNLRVLAGDVQDLAAVQPVIAGADTVISVLGPSSNKPEFAVSKGMDNIITAMKAANVKRLIISAGAGVGDPNDKPGAINHVISFLLHTFSKNVVADMEQVVAKVRASGLDYTIVRVPMLTDDPATGNVRQGWVGINTGPRLSRADMAQYMLKQAESAEFIRQAPVISN